MLGLVNLIMFNLVVIAEMNCYPGAETGFWTMGVSIYIELLGFFFGMVWGQVSIFVIFLSKIKHISSTILSVIWLSF